MTSVGKSVRGFNNERLVAGGGTYVADVQPVGAAVMVVLRSPHPNARIVSVDASRALAVDGVIYVLTPDEIRDNTNPIPEAINTRALGAQYAPWYALCIDRARYVGEAIAAVVAEDEATAIAARCWGLDRATASPTRRAVLVHGTPSHCSTTLTIAMPLSIISSSAAAA